MGAKSEDRMHYVSVSPLTLLCTDASAYAIC